MNQEMNSGINFDLPKNRSNVIKVIGVGGGGSNAINYMFQQGINGVDFIICNTDAQALTVSGVPTKIQLGASLTEGLGAGANPEVGAQAAMESKNEIQEILNTQTKMVFITAGMGGGTGTGAAPVIAQMAKSMNILSVGIVTMPFLFEGKIRMEQAQKGLEKMRDSVDALIVINNNKLREVYGNLGFKAGFAKADEVLATAARGIAEVITHHYTQNIDLKDAKTVLTNSGTAIMGSASASGSNRAQEAIVRALDSPLLNDNKITGCKNVLLLIVSGTEEITIDEIGEINDYIQTEAGNNTNIIMGVGEDSDLGNAISVTVIATGFGKEQQHEISNTEAKKIIHSLEDDQKIVHNLSDELTAIKGSPTLFLDDEELFDSTVEIKNTHEEPLIDMNSILYDIDVVCEIVHNGIEIQVEEIEVFEETVIPPFISEQETTFDEPVFESIIHDEIADTDQGAFSFQLTSIEDDEPGLNTIMDEETDGSSLEEFETDESFTFVAEAPLFSPEFEKVTSFEAEVEEEFLSREHPETFEEDDFVINEVSASLFEMEVVSPEIVKPINQFSIDFDQPIQSGTFKNKSIEEQTEEEPTKSIIKDFDEEALEIQFEVKSESAVSATALDDEGKKSVESSEEVAANPFSKSIESTMAAQNEKRKAHLKAFNYQFKHQMQRIDEMEREPAYKRMGLDLDAEAPKSNSRLTLNTDDNDDLQLRTNNSFLHDNVD